MAEKRHQSKRMFCPMTSIMLGGGTHGGSYGDEELRSIRVGSSVGHTDGGQPTSKLHAGQQLFCRLQL
eukprot:TsM_000623200 transcript=TsM_000623200 gene=TsM_000623200